MAQWFPGVRLWPGRVPISGKIEGLCVCYCKGGVVACVRAVDQVMRALENEGMVHHVHRLDAQTVDVAKFAVEKQLVHHIDLHAKVLKAGECAAFVHVHETALDGNLLIANDRFKGMTVVDGKITLPDRPGIGVVKL